MRRHAAAIGLAALLVLGATTGSRADDPEKSMTLEALDASGQPENRAGAHPDRLLTTLVTGPEEGEHGKDLVIDFPTGLGGDPRATPLCPRSTFDLEPTDCPAATQVGEGLLLREREGKTFTEETPVFNLEPGPNETILFGAANGLRMKLVGHLRPSDFGLSMEVNGVPNLEALGAAPLKEAKFEFWGVPADHQEGTSIPRRAFLTNPTRCGAPLAMTVHARTWEHPELWETGTADTGVPVSGCQDLSFEPKLGLDFDNARRDAPTGAAIDLSFPVEEDPDRRVGSQVRDVNVLLPEGMTVAPAAADGLSTCSDAELGLAAETPAACPPTSRVGSVEITTPQLAKPLRGAIYLGRGSGDDLARLFIVSSASGTEAKFVGALRPDPVTGRLSAQLRDLPELTFANLAMRFDGGPRALLATPLGCGSARAVATFIPYSGTAAVEAGDAETISAPAGAQCPGTAPFEPTLLAGASNARAGRPASFSATVRRQDGEQLPSRLEIAFPPGMTAAPGAVDLCPADAAAAARCPAASRIGSTVAELGPGSSPARIGGDAYLTGPYRRAPFGLALVFKAAIGPFDLGTLVVRGALRIDSASGRVSVVTDTLPTTMRGIQVRFQTIGLDIDRPGFMRNPTSCAPAAVTATVRSASGATHSAASPFAVRGCVDLPFRPRFAMALTGPGELREDGRPGLRISARVPAGNANLRAAKIAFPRQLGFAAAGLREICARQEAIAGNCPTGARVGSGYARTPLLKGAMRGGVYAVQPRGTGTPDIWADFGGSGLEIILKGGTTTDDGRTEAVFAGMPDFPLTSFALRFAGGEHSLFKLSGTPCTRRRGPFAATDIAAQNGALRRGRIAVALPAGCGGRG